MNFTEIQSDAWQLYSDYVHESSPQKISFDPSIVHDFANAFESNDHMLLSKVAEEVSIYL